MSDEGSDPLVDLFNLLASPVAGAVRSAEQVRKGVDDFLAGVENLNQVTVRINSLLAAVEGPLRAALPQFARTVQTADQLLQVVGSSAIAAAPGLGQVLETLRNPSLAQLPTQLTQISDALGDLSRRLGSLTTLAEAAGGLFAAARMASAATTAATAPPPAAQTTTATPPVKKSTAKKSAVKETRVKKAATKKASATKTTATKTTATKKTAATKKAAATRKAAATKAPTTGRAAGG